MSTENNNPLIDLLNTHRGRDSIVRTVSFASLYLSSQASAGTALKLKSLSKELSYCRLLMRLFDDFPMLKYTLNYGFGSEEKNFVLRILGIVKNVLDQLYFPVEHIAWAADKNYIEVNSSIFYTVGAALWGLSSYISIVRSLIMMSILQRKTRGLKNIVLHEKIVGQQMQLLLMAFKDVADVVLAVNYLPRGTLLWAGKLNSEKIGLIGTVSSIIRVLMLLRQVKSDTDTM